MENQITGHPLSARPVVDPWWVSLLRLYYSKPKCASVPHLTLYTYVAPMFSNNVRANKQAQFKPGVLQMISKTVLAGILNNYLEVVDGICFRRILINRSRSNGFLM